jgi:hypothetical protein
MFSHIAHSNEADQPQSYKPNSALRAFLIGILIGGLFIISWPNHAALAILAALTSGLALGLLMVGLFHLRRYGNPLWSMLIGGQVLGVVTIALLFFASLS